MLKVRAPGFLQDTAVHEQELIKKLFNQNFFKKVILKWIFNWFPPVAWWQRRTYLQLNKQLFWKISFLWHPFSGSTKNISSDVSLYKSTSNTSFKHNFKLFLCSIYSSHFSKYKGWIYSPHSSSIWWIQQVKQSSWKPSSTCKTIKTSKSLRMENGNLLH